MYTCPNGLYLEVSDINLAKLGLGSSELVTWTSQSELLIGHESGLSSAHGLDGIDQAWAKLKLAQFFFNFLIFKKFQQFSVFVNTRLFFHK